MPEGNGDTLSSGSVPEGNGDTLGSASLSEGQSWKNHDKGARVRVFALAGW